MEDTFVVKLTVYERKILKAFIDHNLDHNYSNCDVENGKFVCLDDEKSYNFLDQLANSL